jgi:hypothetical protein
MHRPLPWILAILIAGAAGAWLALRAAAPPDDEDGAERIGRFPASQFHMEHDRFLAATDPETVPAAAATYLKDDDEVFGIVLAGQARAYPVYMLAYHHVVNDVIRGIPVAVTY